MKYRKKPIVIEAMKWDGSDNVLLWVAKSDRELQVNFQNDEPSLFIKTLEGTHEAKFGDFIIKGVQGEYYPCKPDIFEATYEKVEGE